LNRRPQISAACNRSTLISPRHQILLVHVETG